MATVSVVMAVWNGETHLEPAIESILGQSLQDLEFIIINDGSTDGTGKILQRYKKADARIQVITQENQALARALNRGLQEARGTYLARMDDDDVSLPDRLAAQVEYLDRHPDVGVVGTWFYVIDAEGHIVATYRPPADPAMLGQELARRNPLCHSSVMLRRSALTLAGGYRDDLRYAQDYELWLRMRKHGIQVGVVPQVLHRFRISPRAVAKYHQQKLLARGVNRGSPLSGENASGEVRSVRQRMALYHYAVGVAKLRGQGTAPAGSLARSLVYDPFHIQTWAWLGVSLVPRHVRTHALRWVGLAYEGP